MTGNKLKKLLFSEKGTLKAFSLFIGEDYYNVDSKFKAKKVDAALLHKLAEYLKREPGEFIAWATGPDPDYTPPAEGLNKVSEKVDNQYNKKKKAPLNSPNQNSDAMTIEMVIKLIDSQRQQNDALTMLARASEINAVTIAKLNGIDADTVGKKAAS